MRTVAVTGIAAVVVVEIPVVLGRGSWWSVVAGFVAVAGLLSCRLVLNPRNVPVASGEPERAESLQRWQRRTETLIGWSEGSRVDWDQHLRPLLARELRKGVAHGTDAETGFRLLGPDLWPWVDPSALTPTADANQPGPGREVLGRILDRLDSL